MENNIEEKYLGEFDDIQKVFQLLCSLFPDVEFDLDYEFGNLNKYVIKVNDFDFYKTNKKFKNWIDIFRKKYPKLKFFCCFQNF